MVKLLSSVGLFLALGTQFAFVNAAAPAIDYVLASTELQASFSSAIKTLNLDNEHYYRVDDWGIVTAYDASGGNAGSVVLTLTSAQKVYEQDTFFNVAHMAPTFAQLPAGAVERVKYAKSDYARAAAEHDRMEEEGTTANLAGPASEDRLFKRFCDSTRCTTTSGCVAVGCGACHLLDLYTNPVMVCYNAGQG